jgi:hypothetical protein
VLIQRFGLQNFDLIFYFQGVLSYLAYIGSWECFGNFNYFDLFVHNTPDMHLLKIKNASHAQNYKHKYLSRKIYSCNANTCIYVLNGECLRNHVSPNYAKIKILETFPGAKYTQKKVHTSRIKDEIKFLYIYNFN